MQSNAKGVHREDTAPIDLERPLHSRIKELRVIKSKVKRKYI